MVDEGLSVIVATRERHRSLVRLLSSLAATDIGTSAEVLIVEDGPPYIDARLLDSLRERFRLRLIQNPASSGIAGARNTGIDAASGSILAFLDDDCVCDSHWAEALRIFITTWHRSVFAGPVLMDETSSNLFSILRERVYYWETFGPDFLHPETLDIIGSTPPAELPYASGGNSVYRADVFRRYGLFDRCLPAYVDVEMGARLQEGDRPSLNRAMIVYHRHPATLAAFLRRSLNAGRAKGMLCRGRAHPGHRISTATIIVSEIWKNILLRNIGRAKRVSGYPFVIVWSVLTISETIHGVGFVRGVMRGAR